MGVDFRYEDQCTPCPDPCLARFNPSCYFGAVSEKFRACVKDYIEKNPDGMLNDDDDDDEDDDEGENEKDQNRFVSLNFFYFSVL